MKKITLLFVMVTFLYAPYVAHGQSLGISPKYIADRFIDSTGREVIKILVPGIPPDNFRMPEAEIPLTAVLLDNVPAFNWSFGCSATSAAMQAAYYDRTGYYNMYTGPTHGGLMPMDNSSWGDVTINGEVRHQCPLSATRNGVDGRVGRGHVDDYWVQYTSAASDPYITNGWVQHTWGQCTGDYMGTNQSALGNTDGNTTFWFYTNGSPDCNYTAGPGEKDGCKGMREFYESRGYTVLSNCNQYIYGYNGNTNGFTFAQYKTEINAGRPVLIQVDGHTMLGFGYDNTGNLVYLHDTWDYGTHTMTWGGSYSGMVHYGVTTIQLQAVTPNPCSNIISLGGGGSANAQTYWGGGEGVWFNATPNACGYNTPGIEQIYSFVPTVTGYYSIQVTNTSSTFVDYMWKATTCSSSSWNCISEISTPGTYGSMYWTAGVTYYILLDDINSNEAEHTFYVFLNPCSNISSIGGTGAGYSQTFAGGGNGAWFTNSVSPCEYTCPGREKIYSFVAPSTGRYGVVVTSASSWVDYMWKASSCSSTGWQCIDDIYGPGTFGSMNMTAGTTYYVLLDDENTLAGSHTFYLNLVETAGTWEGLVDNNWNNPSNWSASILPDATVNVVIPGGTPHQPIIGNGITANAKNVTIQSGAILTQNGTSYFYVNGNFNSDYGQFIMTGSSYLYFAGTDNNYWDDDNENDTYTFVRVTKASSTPQTTMWQNMTCSGTFEVREGVFAIDGTWTLDVTNTSTSAFQVQNGGKLVLTDESIHCAGDVNFQDGSQATINGGTIECAGDFVVGANSTYDIGFAGGTLILNGTGTQYINDLDGGNTTFYNLTVNKTTGVCYIKSANLELSNQLSITGGTLSCNNGPSPTSVNNILIGGNWYNQMGPGGFEESTGTVIFNGSGHQYCYTDNFYNVEVNKSAGALRLNGSTVTVQNYNWSAGAVDVLSGTFIANNLVDNGIAGNYYVNPGGTINLYNTDGWVDLNGHLYIYGGTINVYGGNGSDSYWPYASDAGITMTGGTLDFKDVGVLVFNTGMYTLSENITNGIIRTSGGFRVERSDYNPSGGIVEFYGPVDGTFHTTNGGFVNSITINKSISANNGISGKTVILDRNNPIVTDAPLTSTVLIDDIADINGNVVIQAGILSAGDNMIYVAGNWNNQAGTTAFIEGSSFVEFNGASGADILSSETFYNLNLNKTYALFDGLELGQNVTVTNDLHIIDGTMELNDPAQVSIAGNLNIDYDAGLNANDVYGPQIFVGKNWTNANTSYSIENGFDPGNYSTVTFNGTTDQSLSCSNTQEVFNNLVINKSAGKFTPAINTQSFNDVLVSNGTWDDLVSGLTHSISHNFTVASSGALFNALHMNTFELTGSGNSVLTYSSGTGYFHHLLINKTTGYSVTQIGNTSCQFSGNFTVENGIYNLNGYNLLVNGDIVVNDAGVLSSPSSSTLILCETKNLNVNAGGRIEILGSAGNPSTIRANISTARYNFNINSLGTIAAEYALFQNTGANGVYLGPGSAVDALHSFTGCTFQDGAAGGTLLAVNNSQVLTIRNAVFPSNTWGGASNVAKTLNTGHVYFVDYSGGFSGEAYDADGFNLIDWVASLTASATATPSQICTGGSSQLNVNRTGGLAPYSYHWTPFVGLSDPNIVNPVANPPASVTYTVTLTDALGTTTSSNVLLTVLPVLPVNINITASANPVSPGTFVTFTATPVNGGSLPSYQWKVNGINVGTGLPSYSYLPSYNDQVTCVLTSNYACPSGNPASSNTITMLVVNTNTTLTGTVPSPLTLCFDATNLITVAGSGTTFLVQSGGSALMIAGVRISYLPGTTVQLGGYMHGYITSANEYCGSLSPSMVTVIAGAGEIPVWPAIFRPSFTIYPNPTTGKFTLMHNGEFNIGRVDVVVFDIHGNRILSTTYFDEVNHVLTLQGVSPGLYLIKVMADNHFESFKLILTP